MDIYIYGLYNSFSDEIRYIGKTNNPERRLADHIREAKNGKYKHFPKNKWILKTLNDGGKIFYKILEVTNEKNWEEKEVFWISRYKKEGSILNLTVGGETYSKCFFISYEECKKWVRENVNLNEINSQTKWKEYAMSGMLPDFIPHSPSSRYRYDGFSWYDFLNKEGKRNKAEYISFNELCSFITENKIKNISELTHKVKKDEIINIPIDVSRYYKKRGYDINTAFKKFFNFDEFVNYIKTNFPNLTSESDYFKNHNKMDSMAPFYYKLIYNDVKNIDEIIFERKILSYKECRDLVKKEGIKSIKEYYSFREKNNNLKLPRHPEINYENEGWVNWEEFLNTRLKKTRKKCTFTLFCRYMRIYHPYIKKSTQYIKMMKETKVSKRIPFRPDVKYNKQWKDLFKAIYD